MGASKSSEQLLQRGTFTMSDFPEMVRALQAGDQPTAARLLPLVYDELKKLAAACLAREPSANARQATSLVHEAYLRLVGKNGEAEWNSEGHFFGAAAIAIRRVLVDNARQRASLKRGGQAVHQPLCEELPQSLAEPTEDLVALDEALDRFQMSSPQAAELVQLVYFSGLTLQQAADVLEVSPRTADRLWAYARAWLRREMHVGDEKS